MADRIVMAHQMPMRSAEENPFRALETAMALSSNDWGSAADFAWIYGIVCGWQDDDADYHPDLAAEFGWSDEQVARLKRLHTRFTEQL